MSASDDEEKCDSGREGDVVYETGMWARLGVRSTIGVGEVKRRKSRNSTTS